jgi:Zn-dependent peptidase ImmA (M78 family)
MKLSDLRISQDKKAEELLRSFDLHRFPVDLDSVVEKLGIDVKKSISFEKSHCGEISISGETASIWINDLTPPNRQRFTLAHEIGHYINDIEPLLASNETEKSFIDDEKTLWRGGQKKPEEYRANKFAAALLMPRDLVVQESKDLIEVMKKETKRKKVSKKDFISRMAEMFNVSEQSMQIRLEVLGVIKG